MVPEPESGVTVTNSRPPGLSPTVMLVVPLVTNEPPPAYAPSARPAAPVLVPPLALLVTVTVTVLDDGIASTAEPIACKSATALTLADAIDPLTDPALRSAAAMTASACACAAAITAAFSSSTACFFCSASACANAIR